MYHELHPAGLYKQRETTSIKDEEFLEDHVKDGRVRTLEQTGQCSREEEYVLLLFIFSNQTTFLRSCDFFHYPSYTILPS